MTDTEVKEYATKIFEQLSADNDYQITETVLEWIKANPVAQEDQTNIAACLAVMIEEDKVKRDSDETGEEQTTASEEDGDASSDECVESAYCDAEEAADA